MKIVIVEDEPMAAQHLERLIRAVVADAVLLAQPDSVKSAVLWLKTNPAPDLIFMDIQLGDGKSFQIFEQCAVTSPVIFTTAYDEFALKAFKVNSIDYILKPVDENELRVAIQKFNSLTATKAASSDKLLQSLQQAVQMLSRKYKERFVIKAGEHLRSVETSDLLFFFSQEKTTFAQTREGRKYILDQTLDELEQVLDPARFFRINRKYIIAVSSIQDMISYTNSRLRLILKTSDDKDVIVARERVGEFKEWLDR